MRNSHTVTWMKWLLACILIFAIISIATIKVTVETQIWLTSSAFVIVMFSMLMKEKKFLQLAMLLTGALISIRYIWWRYTETLPWESNLDIPFAVALLVTEIYGITIYLLGMFVNVQQKERNIVPIDDSKPLPSIDVFIPTYNEPIRVVSPTLTAAMQLKYPGEVNVWILDDGGTANKLNNPDLHLAEAARKRTNELKALCQSLGANYISRPDNIQAKAGNINNAMKHSKGKLILILDADHVPTQDFLLNTVGMFQQQPNLGFVQTPHFFATPNPIERNLGIQDKVPAENEMFYNRILKGMDFWNASFFCGSAAVIRRSALEEVGGISTKTITEDADTALNMHAKGWDSAYLNIAMIAGLSPDTFGNYVTQRSRWAQGMIQIFMLNNPLLKRGLSLPQKLCYINSTLFWFFPIFRTVYLLAPLCYLLFDLQIFVGNGSDFLAFAVPHLLISLAINQHLFGKTRNALFSEFYETILSLYLVLPTLSAIVNPRKPSFTVTPKGETTEQAHFSPLAPVLFGLLCIISIAEVWGIYRVFNYPIEQGQLTVVLVFNTLNLILCLACLGATAERRQRRIEPRTQCQSPAYLSANNMGASAVINDASVNGARVTVQSLESPLAAGDVVELTCYIKHPPKQGESKSRIKPYTFAMKVHHSQLLASGQMLSCELLESNVQSAKVLTSLAFSNSQLWSKRREFEEQQEKGILRAMISFFKLAIQSCALVSSTAKQQPTPSEVKGISHGSTQDVR
ncbi:cellulose synthase catalytic subunit (UDP-forming) [Photobacterium sanctipauli]|uniref:Cellulose synthase catalytic subunit [UDP-forming] n=1 Tax=Photobacterium sanctipauli TaxID=1342794 RepID=A0A2T3P080_9GAMM|nr:UDP-forming cellulose synthase catalytic subunit [Photobacterium sanctipauli]PSW21936.1 cellulose synthase catalytic subunit (UDP-forming) [Photobacterium sanctipauli]